MSLEKNVLIHPGQRGRGSVSSDFTHRTSGKKGLRIWQAWALIYCLEI
jgi:hypothetical protein